MKQLKKLLAIALVLALTLALAVPVFAAEGDTGSITIKNATQGQRYSVYKIFDAVAKTENGVTTYYYYANAAVKALLTGENCPFSVSSQLTTNGYAVTLPVNYDKDAVLTWIKNNIVEKLGEATETKVATSNILTFTGLPTGYYYVTSAVGSTVTIDEVNPSAEIIDKNIDWTDPVDNAFKHILVNGDDDITESTDYDIGDTVKFVIGFTAQNFYNNNGESELIKDYTVTDTPVGLAIDLTKITVKLTYKDAENNVISEETLTSGYTVVPTYDEDGVITSIKITIDWAKNNGTEDDPVWNSCYAAPVEVVINYEGTLTAETASNAAAIAAHTVDGETVSHTPGEDEDLDNKIYTYTIEVKKTDGQDSSVTLSGAKFVLTKTENGATKYYLYHDAVEADEDSDVEAADAYVEWVDSQDGATVVETDANGKAEFPGLAAGSYELVETEAPAGYNKLSAPVPVELVDVDDDDFDSTTLTVVQPVENNAGTSLPSTGGMGTTIFYIVGAVLVLGAVVLLVTKKRLSAER